MKLFVKISLPVTLFILCTAAATGQERDSSRFGIGIVTGQDTIIERNIKEVWVYPARQFKSARYEKQYWRLVQRIKKVLPYAKTANQLLRKYEPEYLTLKTDRDKRKLIKRVEDELMAQYKEEFKKMSITDGKVLIKLIDRETGRTSFTLIREFRGAFIATFWQGIARLFGNNLKDEFDPYGEDLLIDEIATMIEIGFL
jgi:ribosomal protein S17E